MTVGLCAGPAIRARLPGTAGSSAEMMVALTVRLSSASLITNASPMRGAQVLQDKRGLAARPGTP